jgi:pimeloyl-ACP methyl ester carboxylesterase
VLRAPCLDGGVPALVAFSEDMFAMRIPSQPVSRGRTAGAERFFAHAGARLRYRDQGSGPVLVLVHGWPLDLELWDPQVAGLRGRFRILRMDRRGFGCSSGAPSLAADSLDLRALLDRTGIERAAVLGMSQGARVALDVATSGDERIACLILDGAPAVTRLIEGRWQEEIPLAKYRRILRDRGVGALRRAMVAHPFLRLHTRARPAQRCLAAMIARYPATDLLNASAPLDSNADATAPQITVPVLIFNGAHDTPQRVGIGAALSAAIPGAERHLVARAGHLANLDNPAEYNAILRRFLERHLSAPA